MECGVSGSVRPRPPSRPRPRVVACVFEEEDENEEEEETSRVTIRAQSRYAALASMPAMRRISAGWENWSRPNSPAMRP